MEASWEAVICAASEGSLYLTWWLASNPSGTRGEKEEEEIMSAWERVVEEGPGVFLERISGGDQEEVTLA